MKKIETETLRHREAFTFYYSLGADRSYQKVAKEFKVSHLSVKKWAVSFDWQERLKEMDAKVADQLDDAVVAAVVTHSERIVQIVESLIDRCTVSLPDGTVVPTIRVETVADFERVVKLHQLLNGGETERIGLRDASNARQRLIEKLDAQSAVTEAERIATGAERQ